jgi:GT2 family glycosyltransferase
MHGGMYFEFDTGISLDSSQVAQRQILRVEHYGKGAPAWAAHFTRSRPIQAVTGAFMSVDRDWFETLGGFTENYVFGHYEDADLCLKSLQRGIAPWLHDIRLWHLEGKGSLRLPVHEGGSLVNRWLFTDTWAELVSEGLYGPTPTSKLLRPARAAERAERASPADTQVVTLTPVGRETRAAARTHQQRRAARKAASS